MITLSLQDHEVRLLDTILTDLVRENASATSHGQCYSLDSLQFLQEKIESFADRIPKTETRETENTWEENRKFFLEHENEFEKQYENLYVAIHQEKVLDTDKELGSLADRIYTKYGNIPFYAEIPGNNKIEEVNFPLLG